MFTKLILFVYVPKIFKSNVQKTFFKEHKSAHQHNCALKFSIHGHHEPGWRFRQEGTFSRLKEQNDGDLVPFRPQEARPHAHTAAQSSY